MAQQQLTAKHTQVMSSNLRGIKNKNMTYKSSPFNKKKDKTEKMEKETEKKEHVTC